MVCVKAERGTLWVTVDGASVDIEIEAGHCRLFNSPAPITVGTLGGDAVVSVTPRARPPGLLGRWWQALAARLDRPAS